MNATTLLLNLAFALVVALVGATVAVHLRQSVIVGYILAGLVMSPYTPGFSGNPEAVDALADIGIILLMFTIGMRLSLRDLQRVGRVAILGGSIQVLLLIGIGYLIGRAVGWTVYEALFFGAVVSNSSSTVLGKILNERGEAGATHTRIALAWSTVQDLSTIVLVVVLSAVVTQGSGNGIAVALGLATLKAGLFLGLVLGVGSRVLPWLFGHLAALRNREIFIMGVAAFALGMAYASTLFGVSLAIGAFIAGVVISESDLSHEILGSVMPLRDVFVGLFFVSVGMLVDLPFVVRYLPLLLLVLAVIVLVKGPLSTLIAMAFRVPPRTALLAGVALAQSAEFSFLMARVGANLGALSPEVFSLLLAGSVGSIILSPSLHTLAAPAARILDARISSARRDKNPPETEAVTLRGHAVICGYGRVGRLIGAALRRRGFAFTVIEQDPDIVQGLRAEGIFALYGNADNPILLDRMGLARARVLVVAIPDALAARRVVEYAQQVNPPLDIVARVHGASEYEFMLSRKVSAAVIGERELALEMTRHTLRRFGVSAMESLAIVQHLRGRIDPDELDTASTVADA